MAAAALPADGADAAAVHHDAAACGMRHTDGCKIIIQRARARLVLDETSAAGDKQPAFPHERPEAEGVEHVHRADMIPQARLGRVVRHDVDRHIAVDGLHLGKDCL